ncbi:MAG: FHA domain-containing protein [Planctomycetota bacterium]|jgi:pSer/pThr/pTyr-binding forkhead associated (FHA) protein
MQVHLTIETRDGRQRRFPVSPRPRTVIGSETTCDLRVPLPSVATKHCEVTVVDGVIALIDLGSEHGTFRNGTRVAERVVLEPADEITVGSVTFRLEVFRL